jgi:hypothetical protein
MRKGFLASSIGSWALLLAVFSIALIGTRKASGESTDDGVPAGMVTYISGGTCPAGWLPASNVEGRIIIAVSDGKDVGMQVGLPLADQEDRAHAHTYTGDLVLPSKSIAAADGPNFEGAQAQSYSIAGTTNSEPSGLPFVQVTTCVKQ